MNGRSLVSSNNPYVPVTFMIAGETYRVQALIDIGFDGELVVPEHSIRTTGEEIPTTWTLADGSQLAIAAYETEIRLGHLAPIVGLVLPMSGESLVGRGVIDHFSVTFDHGRRVLVYE